MSAIDKNRIWVYNRQPVSNFACGSVLAGIGENLESADNINYTKTKTKDL
jgi:hypothetical protein